MNENGVGNYRGEGRGNNYRGVVLAILYRSSSYLSPVPVWKIKVVFFFFMFLNLKYLFIFKSVLF